MAHYSLFLIWLHAELGNPFLIKKKKKRRIFRDHNKSRNKFFKNPPMIIVGKCVLTWWRMFDLPQVWFYWAAPFFRRSALPRARETATSSLHFISPGVNWCLLHCMMLALSQQLPLLCRIDFFFFFTTQFCAFRICQLQVINRKY